MSNKQITIIAVLTMILITILGLVGLSNILTAINKTKSNHENQVESNIIVDSSVEQSNSNTITNEINTSKLLLNTDDFTIEVINIYDRLGSLVIQLNINNKTDNDFVIQSFENSISNNKYDKSFINVLCAKNSNTLTNIILNNNDYDTSNNKLEFKLKFIESYTWKDCYYTDFITLVIKDNKETLTLCADSLLRYIDDNNSNKENETTENIEEENSKDNTNIEKENQTEIDTNNLIKIGSETTGYLYIDKGYVYDSITNSWVHEDGKRVALLNISNCDAEQYTNLYIDKLVKAGYPLEKIGLHCVYDKVEKVIDRNNQEIEYSDKMYQVDHLSTLGVNVAEVFTSPLNHNDTILIVFTYNYNYSGDVAFDISEVIKTYNFK